MKKTQTHTIRLASRLHRHGQALAKKQNLSFSAWIRQLLENELQKDRAALDDRRPASATALPC